MRRLAKTKVAFLGTRYGELNVERQMLGPMRVQLVEARGENEAEIITAALGAQVIVCGGAPKISKVVIRQLPELRAVVRSGVGLDTVDLAECTRRGIYVANVPDYCIEEVATHALALLLSWARKLPLATDSTRHGRWEVAPVKPLYSLKDLVLGVLGFGRIAQALCRMARGIGLQVWAHDPYVDRSRILKNRVTPVDLSRLLRGADFISLHLPLTPETRHIIDRQSLKAMKPTAYLINTARGELIDENSLQRALTQGWIAGTALDVMEQEPPKPHHPLRSMNNVLLTPHYAWYTERSQHELRKKACAEALRVLRGHVPKNLVNREVRK